MSVLWQALNQHPVVSDRDFKRFLRFPPSRVYDERLAENAAWTREWFSAHARPWCYVMRGDDSVGVPPGTRFRTGDPLAVVAVSAGPEAEAEAAARWRADEPDRYFFLECFAAAVVETLLAGARSRCGADEHYCPGYFGWPITENLQLLTLLQANGPLPGPLDVLSSGMLCPKKSQLAVCGLRPPQLHSS